MDYEEKEGDLYSVYTMYERCLVPCANYEEFWQRYKDFLVEKGDLENARNVFMRATMVHIPVTYVRY